MERNGIIGPMDGAKPREVLANNYEDDEESEGSFVFNEQSESKDDKSKYNSNDMDIDD